MASKTNWIIAIFTIVLLMAFFVYYGAYENIFPIMLLGICLVGIVSKKNWGLFFGLAVLIFLMIGTGVELSLIFNPEGIENVYSPVEHGLISLAVDPSFENIGLLSAFAAVAGLGSIALIRSRKVFP